MEKNLDSEQAPFLLLLLQLISYDTFGYNFKNNLR